MPSLGWQVELAGLSADRAALLAEIRRLDPQPPAPAAEVNPLVRLLAELGRSTLAVGDEAARLLSFYGQTVLTLVRVCLRPTRLRLTSLTHHLEQTCVNALPIVGLIAFLIGVVMAYQGADQLRRFGAEIFTVDLLGISILREIGILLTAIVVAGRSGSAFTAQIGTMKVNQEIDALRTLGLDPIEVLVASAPAGADDRAAAAGVLRRHPGPARRRPDVRLRARHLARPVPQPARAGDRRRDLPGRHGQGAGVRLPDRDGRLLRGPERRRQRGERRPDDHPRRGGRRSSW